MSPIIQAFFDEYQYSVCSRHQSPESTNPPKKKLKLSGAAVRDKLMAMRDSDVSYLDTESDSQSLIFLQE